MSEKDDAVNSQSDTLNLNYPTTDTEKRKVMRALETLRLLNDKNNPLPLSQAITHARALAEVYMQWEKSEALIKDIVVRLSDGQEIAMEQSKVSSLCGLRIRNTFDPQAVLHIWKKADHQFDEVQLLSLSLSGVDVNGYRYEKTYKNGQTLSLKVEMCTDGQLYISVNFTATERMMAATDAQSCPALPVSGPVAAGLSILSLFRRRPRAQLGKFTPERARRSKRAIAPAVYAPEPNYALKLMAITMVLSVVALTITLSGDYARKYNEQANVLSNHAPAMTPSASPSPENHSAANSTPMIPKKSQSQPRNPYNTHDHVRYARDFRTTKAPTVVGSDIDHKNQIWLSNKPLADILISDESIEFDKTSRGTSNAAQIEAFIWSFMGDKILSDALISPKFEMGRPLIITNRESNGYGEIRIKHDTSRQREVTLEAGSSIYIAPVMASSLDQSARSSMREEFIELVKKSGYSVPDKEDDGFLYRVKLELRYNHKEKEEEQVFIRLFIDGQRVWTSRESCVSTSGLQKKLCEESLKLGQQFSVQSVSFKF